MLETNQLACPQQASNWLLETNFVVKPVRLLARWLARWFGLECSQEVDTFGLDFEPTSFGALVGTF